MSKILIDLENKHSAHNYHPLPVVFARASGVHVWDPEGKQYIDFLSAYSAVNQGHCHPKIVGALAKQAATCCLPSRAFHNSLLGPYARKAAEVFGYEMLLPMNTGAEAVETALKLARKWGYQTKKIPQDKAIVFAVSENFHGRTLSIVAMSTEESTRNGFGPHAPRLGPYCPDDCKCFVPYNDIAAVENVFKKHGNECAAILVEPIQGEAGIVVPSDDYFPRLADLCKRFNVLLIADEIQTGLGRTGSMLAHQHNSDNSSNGVKADIVLLGKALSGGVYPVSAVLSSANVMLCIQPGEHGSTYGGNPLACATAMAALDVIVDEDLCRNAREMGELFRKGLEDIAMKSKGLISCVRGRGLLNAIVIDDSKLKGMSAWHFCLLLASRGLLAKPTHKHIVRLAPPLCITREQIMMGLEIISSVARDLPTLTAEQLE